MILISLATLAPGRMGGSERYARELVTTLAMHGTLDYEVLVPPDAIDAAAGLTAHGIGSRSDASRPIAFARAGLARRAMPRAEAVHYPLTVPLPGNEWPTVVTLHDVLHLEQPELVPRATRLFRRWAYDRAARRADRVIVPSAFVRDRATELLDLEPARVRVVPHGIDHGVFHPGNGRRQPLVLYPAKMWRHKNHARLFAAWPMVLRERPDLELVLSGGGHDSTSLPAGVRSVGNLPDIELAALYRSASALVFPSLYEGFGWPVVEAMASGCPVAAARGSAIDEVAAGAASMFAPESPEDLARAVLAAVADDGDLVARGLSRAAEFTWARCAREHESVYRELLR
jgi:glycosyltransferase involved in cell wall biosynthesis